LAETFSVETVPTMIGTGEIFATGRTDVAIAGYNYLSGEQEFLPLFNDGVWWTPPPISRTYVGPTGGNWSIAGNWGPSGAPSAFDFVTISGRVVNVLETTTVASLTLTNGATLAVSQNGSRVLRTSSITIDAASKLDLKDNGLAITNGTAWGVKDLIIGGRVISSTAGASAVHPQGIGYADASAVLPAHVFMGQTIGLPAVLVRGTYLGDANLDGTVNSLDFGALASSFNLTGRVWSQGDFNFDGITNALDFNAIATNFGQTAAAQPPASPAVDAQVAISAYQAPKNLFGKHPAIAVQVNGDDKETNDTGSTKMRTPRCLLLTVLLLTSLAPRALAASGDIYNLGALAGSISYGYGLNVVD
jgi:hypothetical protein